MSIPDTSILRDCAIDHLSPARLFENNRCWAHPRAGAIPPRTVANPGPAPKVVMLLQPVALTGSDLYFGPWQMRSGDLGRTWSAPEPLPGFERRPLGNGREILACDFVPRWHAASGTLLATGHTAIYEDGKLLPVRPRATAYTVYDPVREQWSAWERVAMPELPKFENCGAGSCQWAESPGGDLLLPVHFRDPAQTPRYATVLRCRFDGRQLTYREHGSEMTLPHGRGLLEPSLIRFREHYFLTLRNDEKGYFATSPDGLHYDTPRPWRWEDGAEIGNYNTQQHWATQGGALFLIYTRRGANNDHVIRHRAPLFIAQVDPEKGCLIRSSERELLPNRGARLGNFGVTEIAPGETWVTDAEWMQPAGCEKHGADGTVWIARLRW